MNTTQRTIKIVVATVLAVWIAQLFELDYTLAAGVIAILSVLDTKQESIKIALARIGSMILGFCIASILFVSLGFSLFAFGLYLAIFIPLACKGKMESGIAPTTVLVTHFITAESVSWDWQINGTALMLIGVFTALLVNLWMPKQQNTLEKFVEEIESEMSKALLIFHDQLVGDQNYRELFEQLKQLDNRIQEMNHVALNEYANQVFKKTSYYVRYAQMRKEQSVVLQKMCENLPAVKLATSQNDILADLFKGTAEQLHEKNTGLDLLQDISDLYQTFKASELPQTRKEFESRAILFQILNDFTRFIKIKREFFLTEKEYSNQNDD
ncbi:aromatic acid exporter family protein [Marinilactibacillus sp. XAAS-LB27]|uniref:aromatic acid exporter family protein n=1 Tax=Marinilactibacillus sp. XAAS-LB27 TaxID=3114538 RepID=UPI002E1702BE|nr:aromatic acid exporter family protein [Marinilactibacillus sp. XAAS-LB27]